MKEFLKTKQGKIIVGMGSVIVILIIALIALKVSDNDKDTTSDNSFETSAEKAKEDAKSPYNLYKGHWYSDRDDRSEIILEKDGTYTGSGWVTSGKYEFVENNSVIEFSDSLDGIRRLVLKTVDGETVLYDENSQYTFYSSQDQLESALKNKESEAETNQALFEQKWGDVLKKGVWEEYEGNDAKVEFNDTEFSNSYLASGNKKEEETHTYEIKEVKNIDETAVSYIVQVDDVGSYELNIGEQDDKYLMYFSFLPAYRNYSKNVADVPLTQQGTTQSEGEKDKETITETTDSSGNKVTKKEKVVDEKDGWD